MKISVITVAFNASATIGDALRSVTSQRGANVESIVIDGGSTDQTLDVVESFGSKIATIVSERDRGIYDAMNKGLARATGDVVAFLNADDYYQDDLSLAAVAEVFARSKATLVAGAVQQVNSVGKVVRTIQATSYRAGRYRWGAVPPHPGLFMTTQIARRAGGFDPSYRIAGDFDLFIRMSRQPDFRLETMDRTLVKMRTGGVSTSGMGIYLHMSKELKLALTKNGISSGNWRVDLRALRKFPELLRARIGY